MKLFIQQANKSSLKLQSLETLSSMSQDEMMNWSGGYGKPTACCKFADSPRHSRLTLTYDEMGAYGKVTISKTICHYFEPYWSNPKTNPHLFDNNEKKNGAVYYSHKCRGDHNHH